MEITQEQTKSLQPSEGSQNVNKLTKKTERCKSHEEKTSKLCFRCGIKEHDPKACPAINWECFVCKKEGHKSKVCRKRKNIVKLLENCFTLSHYNPQNEIIITTDASAYGLGAILSQKIDGEVRPIMCASCTLNSAEMNYSQVEKEAMAIIFAVKKINKFIYGQKFTLVTDHLPLKTLFDPKKNIPTLAHSRLQRWAIILSGYQYEIHYTKGSEVANDDGLSRLLLEKDSDITAEEVQQETRKTQN
jgi:hypothetical protein